MRRAGKVVAEMHEATRAAPRPGVTTAPSTRWPETCSSAGAPVQLPQLPRVPGRHLHVAQLHDRPRHPIGPRCSRRATSSRSTAGRSSRATTAMPPLPWASGRSPPRPTRLLEVTEGSLWAGIDQLRRRQPAERGRAGPSRRSRRGPGSPWSVSTSATPSARRCTRSPRCPTTGRERRAPCSSRGWCSPSSRWSTPEAPRRVQLDDGWSVVTADGRLSAHFEHTIAVTDNGPEVFTVL